MKKTGTIIAVCISILLLVFPVLFFWIMSAFDGLTTSFIVPLIGVTLVVLIGFITFSIENKKFYKKTIILLSCFILLMVGAIL